MSEYPDHELILFNRWGTELFRAKPYRNDWGGKAKGGTGDIVPAGTYFYILKLGKGKIVDGYIYIAY